jgi:hypothetical protein
MKPEFEEYLGSISVPAALRGRIAIHYESFRFLCPEDITGIFVGDYITQEATRIYESLHFFSDSFVMEAKNFSVADHFDRALVVLPLRYFIMNKQDYDFKKATDASRMYFLGYLPGDIRFEFKASKENCDFLRDLIHKYILPKNRR